MLKFKSGYTLLTFLIILVLLGGGLILYSFTYPNQADELPIPSPTPKQNQIDPTAKWKTYRNEEYRFEFKYPEYFITQVEPESDLYEFAISFLSNSDENISTSIKVDSGKLEDVVQLEKWRLVGHVVDDIESETIIKVDGNDGVRLEYEYDLTPPEEPARKFVKRSVVILSNEMNVYSLFSESTLMDQILSTFKFID